MKHYKGGLYRVIGHSKASTNGESEGLYVVYLSLTTGALHHRRAVQFHEKMGAEGPPRFRLLTEAELAKLETVP